MAYLANGRTSKRYTAALAILALAGSITLAPVAQAKRLSFEMPTYDKLIESAGPSTNDVTIDSSKPAGDTSSSPAAADAAAAAAPGSTSDDLRPLTLNGEAPAAATTGEGVLQGNVNKDTFAARNNAAAVDPAAPATGKTQSVVEGKKAASLGKAKPAAPDVGPLALQVSPEEQDQQIETELGAEKQELQDLWQATIMRNPDIQFVINKLQPTSDQAHATAYMMKALGQALFGVLAAAPMLAPTPSPAMFMGSNAGASLLANLFSSHEAKQAKKYAISQEQATILYKIVRDVADKLVENYRDYKKEMAALESAQRDFDDLQRMVAETNVTVDPAKAIEMEYTLRKAKRDIVALGENIRRERQSLVDLAGSDAVIKLDQQLIAEREALKSLAGDQSSPSAPNSINPQLNVNPKFQIGTKPAAQPEKKSDKPM